MVWDASVAVRSHCKGKCIHSNFKKQNKMSNSLSHQKESVQIKCSRKPGDLKKGGMVCGGVCVREFFD